MKHILSSGLVAGLAAGLLCALLQYLLVEPKILLAEGYESGELVHFQGVAGGSAAGHSHDAATAEAGQGAQTATAEPGHNHAVPGEAMSPGKRHALTVLFAVLTYAGYGLVLAGGMMAAETRGLKIGKPEAILWGLAGFLAFQLMPALGLQPDLPGTPASDLTARQVWWAATAIATIVGLGLLTFGTGLTFKLVGVAIAALPHLVGAPELDSFGGVAPPELAAAFAARTLGVGLLTWLALGLAVESLWHSERA
jgi:cobalt transporter subunit CbtA